MPVTKDVAVLGRIDYVTAPSSTDPPGQNTNTTPPQPETERISGPLLRWGWLWSSELNAFGRRS